MIGGQVSWVTLKEFNPFSLSLARMAASCTKKHLEPWKSAAKEVLKI